MNTYRKSMVHLLARLLRVSLSAGMVLALIFSAVSVTPAQAAGTRYVKQGGTGDCSSWANACDLQTALTGAASGDQIWVAAGVYKPGAARTDTFQLKTGVAVYGGFAGTETLLSERNPAANVTILSGDIDSNDTNTDGNNIAETAADIQGDNAYHVVTGSGTDATAVLDGFTITAGQANGAAPHNTGGGMYSSSSSPTLTNVTFSGNSAHTAAGCTTQQQPHADQRHLQRQLAPAAVGRRDGQPVQQPHADQRHLQRQLRLLRRRDVQR